MRVNISKNTKITIVNGIIVEKKQQRKNKSPQSAFQSRVKTFGSHNFRSLGKWLRTIQMISGNMTRKYMCT